MSKKEVKCIMKEGLHPEFTEAKVVCACGNVLETQWMLIFVHNAILFGQVT